MNLKNDNEGPEGQEAFEHGGREIDEEGGEVGKVRTLEGVEPQSRADGPDQAEDEERHDAPDDLHVHLTLKLGAFVPRPAVVEHGLGLVAGVDDDALHEVRVLKHTLAKKKVVFSDRNPLAPRV